MHLPEFGAQREAWCVGRRVHGEAGSGLTLIDTDLRGGAAHDTVHDAGIDLQWSNLDRADIEFTDREMRLRVDIVQATKIEGLVAPRLQRSRGCRWRRRCFLNR